MNPVKCIFFLVAMVFLVSCTGSSRKEGGQEQAPGKTTQQPPETTPVVENHVVDPPQPDPPPVENPLNVQPIAQEAAMSCWAACAEMIMKYVRKGTAWENVPVPRQCEQTAHEWPDDFPNCCDTNNNSMTDGCSASGWPEFTFWHFTCNTNINSSLPWDDATNPINSITGQIDARRPIAFSWQIDGEGSHMMVLIGYNTDADVKTMTYLYPDYGQATKVLYNMLPLSEYNGEDSNYRHEYDYYNIQVSGDPPQ